MQKIYYVVQFAQAYGEGVYGGSTYACTDEQVQAGTCAAGGATGGSGGSGGLADTGLAITIVVTLACLIALAALVVRFWRRPSRQAVQKGVVDNRNSLSTDK